MLESKILKEFFIDYGKRIQVQKVFLTHMGLMLNCRIPGKSFFILIPQKKMNFTIGLTEKKCSTKWRIKNAFQEFLHKHLKGHYIDQVLFCDVEKWIVIKSQIYIKDQKQFISTYFIFYIYSHNQYFFYYQWHQNERQLKILSPQKRGFYIENIDNSVDYIEKITEDIFLFFRQLSDQEINIYRIPLFKLERDDRSSKKTLFNENSYLLMEKKFQNLFRSTSSELWITYLEKIGGSLDSSSKKTLGFLERKRSKIVQDLKKLEPIDKISLFLETDQLQYQDDNNQIEKCQFSYHLPRFEWQGLSFSWHECRDFYEKRNKLYEKLKKWKKGKKILEERLKEVELQVNNHVIDSSLVERNQNKPILGGGQWIWSQNAHKILKPNELISKGGKHSSKLKKRVDTLSQKVKIYKNPDFQVAIGLTAQANDEIRKNWATKNDWWFHVDNEVSPHIYLKFSSSTGILQQPHFHFLGSIFVLHFKRDQREWNLVYTQVKHLKGFKGQAGKVVYKQEKYFKIWLKDQYIENCIKDCQNETFKASDYL